MGRTDVLKIVLNHTDLPIADLAFQVAKEYKSSHLVKSFKTIIATTDGVSVIDPNKKLTSKNGLACLERDMPALQDR